LGSRGGRLPPGCQAEAVPRLGRVAPPPKLPPRFIAGVLLLRPSSTRGGVTSGLAAARETIHTMIKAGGARKRVKVVRGLTCTSWWADGGGKGSG
jgi:hypothetical protein